MSGFESTPFIVPDGGGPVQALRRIDLAGRDERRLSESWLQRLVFEHPDLIPIGSIEPAFGPLLPCCRELGTPAGPLDVLYVSPEGYLTLAECKLWRNPEARRQVVAQILDYAKEFTRWSYDDLDRAIREASPEKIGLYEIASRSGTASDEAAFVDTVQRSLRRGRFLLLILGDGIQEGVEHLAEYLQTHAHLNFSLALIEVALFDVSGAILAHARPVLRTSEITRAVIRIEGDGITASQVDAPNATGQPPRRTKISEQVFFEKLGETPTVKEQLRAFLRRTEEHGLEVEPGDNSLLIKSEDGANFVKLRVDGTWRNYGLGRFSSSAPEIVSRYLERLADLIPGGAVERKRADDPVRWTVVKNGKPAPLSDLLAIQDPWFRLVTQITDELNSAGLTIQP